MTSWRIFKIPLVFSLLLSPALVSAAGAAPKFAHIFADHAVLQRDQTILIWGTNANPESKLQIRFGNETVSVRIDENGNWQATLPKQNASHTGTNLELVEDEAVIASVKDVVVGEVWLAAGQSNMQFRVSAMVKGLPDTRRWVERETSRPMIRFRRVDDKVLPDRNAEAADLNAAEPWVPMSPETVLNFSAVAAAFSVSVAETLEVPIGIIDVSWGGKPIEPFIPREAFSTSFLQKIVQLADAGKIEELKTLEGGVFIRNPEGHPGSIFNARMAPLSPFALRGFLWYQAESNAGKGEDPRKYRHKMEALFRGWRSRWKSAAELPCYFVQLPGFPPATGWIRAREEQRLALEIPDTGMAVTIDLPGEDIHPPMKIPVGERLAKLALEKTYQVEGIVSSGPVFRAHEIKGREVRVQFSGTAGGLTIENGDELKWFELADSDGHWHPAKATIVGDSVVVTGEAVPAPVAVRYACTTYPFGGNLFNKAGLPASPFCSDLDLLPWVDVPQ